MIDVYGKNISHCNIFSILTDMFPSNAVPSILGVARKLHAQTALQSWDICEYLFLITH